MFLQAEDGTPGDAEIVSFGKLSSYGEVIEAIGELYGTPHDFKTVVIDSVTELERMVFSETCRRGDDRGNAKNSIEDFGYGKGYVYAQRVWSELLEALNILRSERRMAIVLIAHSKIATVNDPDTVSYDQYQIDLHKQSVGMIEREMDTILFLRSPVTIKKEDQGFNKERTRAEGGNVVMAYCVGKPSLIAKNRYGLPASLRIDKGAGYAALAPYFPETAGAPVAAEQKDAA